MLDESPTIPLKRYKKWGSRQWFEESMEWSNLLCTAPEIIPPKLRYRIYYQFGAFAWLTSHLDTKSG